MKITLPPLNDIKEYNRKTTDYGNGMIEIVAYHQPKETYIGARAPSSKKILNYPMKNRKNEPVVKFMPSGDG